MITQTDYKNLKLFRRGKVRDVYEIDDRLLIVATDRVSAFDVIMPNPIPHKGEVLTKISAFWFDQTKDIIDNHVISTRVDQYPESCGPYRDELRDRSMLVAKTDALPVECIVRGYLSGSGWKDYLKTQSICGIALPAGLRESEKLSEPIFTPSTKAEAGHDQNIPFEKMQDTIGSDLAKKVKAIAIQVYLKAQRIAEKKGIIIADTKMEFGLREGNLILIDELLTPDSSRFWPAKDYQPGRGQSSFDKQFLRDYLISIHWDNNTPAPQLPESIIQNTSEKYLDAYRLLTQ